MAIDLTLRRDLSRLLFDAEVDDNFVALRDAIQGVLDEKGAASGLATLGADGRLSPGQIPAVQALPATAHDLNTYQLPGMYRQASTAGAQAGTNYPQVTGGLLEVCGTGSAGQTVQRYTVASTGSVSPTSGTRQYWRFAINAAWSAWQEVHTAGNALPYLGRVEAGADLNDYANRGMWAVAASSVASGGTNFPVANSGWLLVYCEAAAGAAAGTNVIQVYIGSNSNRQFFRSLVGGLWSGWEEIVRSSMIGAANGAGSLDASGRQPVTQAPYSAILPAGTDANTLVTPGVWHINSDAQATAALNWPVLLAGTLNVEAVAAGNMQVTQIYTTRNGTGGVIRRFVRVRFGASGGTWGSWQEIAIFETASGRLPASRLPAVTESLWNGATLDLTGSDAGAIITGDFPGIHSATAVRFKGLPASPAGATYVQAVPAAAGGTSAFLARENESANASFVSLANDTSNNLARLIFSRHGTGAVLTKLVIQSLDQECGSIGRFGEWTFGAPPTARAANTAQTATYAGGTSQWGLLMAPRNLNDGAAIAFQNTSGSLVGSVTTSATATSFNVSSDYRLKNLKGDSDKEAGRARIMAVKIRDFTWKADGRDDTGVIAHELAETHPRAVTGEKDAVMEMAGFEGMILPQSVDYSKLVPDLVLTVQAMQGQIDALTARLTELRGGQDA